MLFLKLSFGKCFHFFAFLHARFLCKLKICAMLSLCCFNKDDFVLQRQLCVAAVFLCFGLLCQHKHVLLLNTLTCLSILVDMNPNVNPPLKPGQIYLVDGGFSTQLSKYLGSETVDGDPLWTARSLIDSPDTVCRVHRDFLASR